MSHPTNYQRLTVQLVREGPQSTYPAGNSPAKIYAALKDDYASLGREHFLVIPLDVQNRILGVHVVSVGTLTSSLAHPREFFQVALLANAAAVIAVHNHPSGDTTPSRDDISVTKRLIDAGQLLGIPLRDHIIIGESYHSIRSNPSMAHLEWASPTSND